MAVEADPEKRRTVRIFTKPDLVDKGARTKKVKHIKNIDKSSALFCHVMKCRGEPEEGEAQVSIETARIQEKEYFKKTYPWNDLNEDMLGRDPLVFKLSGLLLVKD